MLTDFGLENIYKIVGLVQESDILNVFTMSFPQSYTKSSKWKPTYLKFTYG